MCRLLPLVLIPHYCQSNMVAVGHASHRPEDTQKDLMLVETSKDTQLEVMNNLDISPPLKEVKPLSSSNMSLRVLEEGAEAIKDKPINQFNSINQQNSLI